MKIPETTYGLTENLISTFVFFCPNFLFIFVNAQIYVFLVYNFIIMFVLMSVGMHFRFSYYTPPQQNLKRKK